MKNWYEWMRDRQDPQDTKKEFHWKNLFDETACLREWLDRGDYYTFGNQPSFQGKPYAKTLDDHYLALGITREQVAEWIDDPEYERLIQQAGIQVLTTPSKEVAEQFLTNIKDVFPIDWSTHHMLMQVQRPGDMWPLHYDRYKNQSFDAGDDVIQRWLIMLYDQQPGQCFFMNHENVSWQAGDVISWNQTNYAHGGANFGYYPRFTVRITGRLI